MSLITATVNWGHDIESNNGQLAAARSRTQVSLIRQIVQIYKNYGYPTQVLTASVRHPLHVVEAALAGSHVATIPFKVLDSMFNHPLTDKGLAQFLKDWEKAKT